MKILENLYYSKDHEWVKVEGNTAYIGITDHAQHSLGSIVFVELPEEGSDVIEGQTFGVVESVKAASDIYSPLDGKVLKVNNAIVDDPALVNEDAYENWMICIELTNKDQLNSLLDAKKYEEICK